MNARSSRLRRIRRLKGIALGLAVAAIAAPAALADPPQGHRADPPDALARYLVNNSPVGAQVLTEPDPGRPQLAIPATSSAPSVVIRGDYKAGIGDIGSSPVVAGETDSAKFNWLDALIGAAFGVGLAVLGASALVLMRRGRRGRLATA